jgi:aspartyl-tRNA(Asn)/glutamyl-tRNA(Gln) amidotransferase subunit A
MGRVEVMNKARDLEIVEMIAAMKKGELTAGEISQSCLEVIGAYNEKLRAFIRIDPDVVTAQCRRIDSQREMKNRKLRGIPIAIKDLIDVAGEPTTSGSSFFRAARPAESDAPIVQRLRDSGAVIFGKTNLHEFAWGGTSENPHFGFCRNPWNPDHSAGGSSGGNGVAIATHMAPGALGTDTLGSIRHPSSFCGIVGLKPTYGLLPTKGIFPLAHTFDHVGPMARTVADAGMIFQALLDPGAHKLLIQGAAGKTTSSGKSRRLAGLKIGRLPALVPREICHEKTWEKYQRAFELAEDEGAVIVDEHIPDFEAALGTGFVLVLAQASEIHYERMATNPGGFGDDVRSLLELGYMVSGVDYIRAQRLRARIVEEAKLLARRVDAWIVPTTPQPAPRIGQPLDPTLAFFTGPICTLGFPSIAIPSGLTKDNLPVSIQIVGGPHKENLLLDMAAILEERLDFPKSLPAWMAQASAAASRIQEK